MPIDRFVVSEQLESLHNSGLSVRLSNKSGRYWWCYVTGRKLGKDIKVVCRGYTITEAVSKAAMGVLEAIR